MANSNGDSLTELERQAEANRAELAHTVDELHSRVSPRAIKEDMRGYARERGQQMLESLEQRARENPLQAVAIAAGLAYPLWRLLANAPAPLLMIGAGLAMSGRHTGSGHERSGNGVDSGAAGVASAAKEKVSDIAHQLSGQVSETIGTALSKTSEATSSVSERLRDTYHSGSEAAAGAYVQTRDSALGMIERHPFLVGGVTFAIGSLVASALPMSRQEDRLMGRTSETLKRRTKDMAAEGFEQAKSAASDVYEAASTAVTEKGLTPEAARETVRVAARSTRDAVQQTIGGDASSQREGSGRPPRDQRD
jgi:ElaB/YqjD/DUF883 family membrane-anchored ribosome-binding protein